jgi:hypothetical protein
MPPRHIWQIVMSQRSLPLVRDQRWPTAPLFVMNISPSFREFMEPLCHILPIQNVTINSNNLWLSAGHSPFALRNRMAESTSHLAGLWIGAAVSNTSHSKPVLPLSNEHGSQVKGQGRRQSCHHKHKRFPYQPTRDVSLLSGHVSIWSERTRTGETMDLVESVLEDDR